MKISIEDTIRFGSSENRRRRHIATFAAYAKRLGPINGKAKMNSIASNSLAKDEIRNAAKLVLSTME